MLAAVPMQTTLGLTLPGPFAGVAVDMDGTLVDTEPLWLIAKQRMFARYATAFEPRCLRMPNPWAGSPLTRATRRTSSNPSSTSATSSR